MSGRVYDSCVRSSIIYGSETRPLLTDLGLNYQVTEMHNMVRWICGISMKDIKISEQFRKLVGVETITTVIKRGRLSWYGHVIRKTYEDWVKIDMEIRLEGRRPVGIQRKP